MPSQIFSQLYGSVEDAVMRRAVELELVWQHLDDPKAKSKLALLQDMVKRAKVSPGQHEA